MLLIQLLWYTFLMVFAFVSFMYIIGRKFKGLSPDEAEKEVKDMILSGFGLLKKEELEPVPTDILHDKLLAILQSSFSLNPNTVIYWVSSDFGFFAPSFDIVATYDEEKFQLATAQLDKCIKNYLTSCGYNPLTYVYYEPHESYEFYFFICYACTNKCKENLQMYIDSRKKVVRNDAIAREKPVIDEELEEELRNLK